MTDDSVTRKLTAILYADVAGYSRLTGADEVGTHKQLSAGLDLISGRIDAAGGRVVHYAGDAVLAEFASVVAAVETAVDIQRSLGEMGADVPNDQRLAFRIGVNLGEVIVDRDDIYGDGVNVAARLESLAETGGVCLSGAVYEQVNGKLDIGFKDMGPQAVKNIAQPVAAYMVEFSKPAADQPAEAPLAAPDMPSVAVLPFDNMSSDPDQEFFADGLVEDIITTLSKVPNLFVIARNSSFAYKGAAVDIRTVARELGVKQVLEGSVRSGGNRLRITAQLIDAETGRHIWADRFDRVVDDLFDIQDEITKEIVTALRIELTDGDIARIWNEGTHDITAWGYVVEASEVINRVGSEDIRRTRELAGKAAKIDPGYATAWALLGMTYWYETRTTITDNTDDLLEKAAKCIEKALELDSANPNALGIQALSRISKGVPEEGIEICSRGVALNPGSADIRGYRAFCLLCADKADEAIEEFEIAMRLTPHPPVWYRSVLARARDAAGDPEGALAISTAVRAREPDNFPALLHSTSLLARSGRMEEASDVARDVLRMVPDFRIASITQWLMMRDGGFTRAFADGLRKAGLPE